LAERAHPDDINFKNRVVLRRKWKILPYIQYVKNPWRTAFFYRYKWANQYCKGKDVLDVPCGMGWGTSLMRGCKSLIGVDLSEEAIDVAKKRYGEKSDFIVGDMRKLDFEDSSFDVIICMEGIEHVSVDAGEEFFCEANRLLRSGGQLLLSSPYPKAGKHSGNPYHVYEYKPEEIEPIIEKHFKIIGTHAKDVAAMEIHFYCANKK
jgi:ubiquinone/menaquinone biosynthesis C-methylase UbiE